MKNAAPFKSLKAQLQPKSSPLPASMQSAEEEGRKALAPSIQAKREREASQKASMTGRFFFSVVFVNEVELEDYVRAHEIRLHDDEYVFGSEVDVRPAK